MSVEKMDIDGSIQDLEEMYKDIQDNEDVFEFNDVSVMLRAEFIKLKNKNRDLSKKRKHYNTLDLQTKDVFTTILQISEMIGKNSYRLLEIRSELLAIKRHNLVFFTGDLNHG